MKNVHHTIMQIATQVLDNILKRLKKRPSRFEYDSALRSASDFALLTIAPTPPRAGQRVHVTTSHAIFGQESQKLACSSRSDFEIFARFVEAAELTPQWVKHDRTSMFRVTGKLLSLFDEAQKKAVELLPNTALAELVVPNGPMPFAWQAAGLLARSLFGECETGSTLTSGSWNTLSVLLVAVASFIRQGARPGVLFEVCHPTEGTLACEFACGEKHVAECWTQTFQFLVMQACVGGWLSVRELGPTRTVMEPDVGLFVEVIASIRGCVSDKALLAAHVDPDNFLKNAHKYQTLFDTAEAA